jgi:HK97 family phage major capsid protein
MFVRKSQAEIAKMNDEEYETYLTQKEEFEATQRKEEIESQIKEANKNNVSKEEIEKLSLKLDTIVKEHEQALLTIKSLREKPTTEKTEGLAEEMKANKEQINAIAKGSQEEVVIKAVTNRASITNNTQTIELTTIGQLGVKMRSLYDKVRKITIGKGNHNGTISYHDWDEATTVRAAAMVAEGAAFPESTAKFQEYTLKLRKIGDTLPVTEEFFEDEQRASAELEMFLDTNVSTKIDDQIINGDGTGENLKGLLASVPAYTPVASGIPSANIYDLVKKVRTDITKTRGSKYRPDMVVMNSDTLDRLQLEKDANDNYIFRDTNKIGNLEFVIDDNLADNVLVVGDSRYASIYEMGGVVLSKGEVNAQFTSDMMTIKARKRLLFLIRTVDQTGFRKVTDITAALATLAS